MADDPFDSLREVLSNARDHINDLDARIKAFFEREPYARVIDFDRDTGEDVYKVRLTARLPGKLAAVTKDAFANLRDALDHAVYASAVSIRPGTSPNNTSFPFSYDAIGVHEKLNKEVIGVPPAIRTLIEGLRPHKTGDQTLWGLNSIRNVKTHRVLVPLGAAAIDGSVGLIRGHIGQGRIGFSRWDATKNEIEYMRLVRAPHTHLEHHVRASFDVLFGDVKVFAGRKAIPTLNEVADKVGSILGAIEVETARLLRSTA